MTIKRLAALLLASAALPLAPAGAAAHGELSVAASIKPVHSLVAGVMEGVGTPALVVRGAGSPHTYSLRPSEARALDRADVVFWVGEDLEAFLVSPLSTLAADARVVALSEAPGIVLLPFREGGAFDAHAHDHGEADHGHDHGGADHGHDHADADHGHDHAEADHGHDHAEADHGHDHAEADHGHDHAEADHGHDHAEADHGHDHAKADHGHDHAEADHGHDHAGADHGHDHAEADHGHDHAEADHGHGHDHAEADHGHDHAEADHGHDHGAHDMHVWLDPMNAQAMVRQIAEALAEADPEHAAIYRDNAAAMAARLDGLVTEVDAELAPVRDRGFIVFHDAYHYFEDRFGLEAAGSITVSPETMPGAARIADIRERVADLGATCVFAEPQFEPRIVEVVVEGTDARAGVLDPLGADLEDGPDLYFDLIRGLASSFRTCLAEAS